MADFAIAAITAPMMLLLLLISIALLAAVVIALHRHQKQALARASERDQILPPLNHEQLDTDRLDPDRVSERGIDPVSDSPANTQPESPAGNWKERCVYWRNQGDYEQALNCCQEVWPQWQSYQQAAIVMRAGIRASRHKPQEQQLWYQYLYQLAVQASFLHDRIEGVADLSAQQVAKVFDPGQLQQLDAPWQDLGCNQLRLLTSSDRQKLTTLYGEPARHQSARQLYAHLLPEASSDQQS